MVNITAPSAGVNEVINIRCPVVGCDVELFPIDKTKPFIIYSKCYKHHCSVLKVRLSWRIWKWLRGDKH
jgi:hypothetical protein